MAVDGSKKKKKGSSKNTSSLKVSKQKNSKKNDAKAEFFDVIELDDKTMVLSKTNANFKKIGYIVLYLVVILSLCYLFFPKIELTGRKVVRIPYNEKYIEPGYRARILFRDETKRVKVTNNIVNGQTGEYKVNYIFKAGFITFKKTRIVKIVDDIKPEIIVPNDILEVCPGIKPVAKYKAIDGYDGDITDKVIVNEKEEQIDLLVSDNAKNVTVKKIVVKHGDTTKPVIVLNGGDTIYLSTSTRYSEQGYTASDNCDGDITDKVTVEGTVGIKPGTYEITYKVTDKAGNKEEIKRKVIVRNTNLYNSGNISNGAIYLTFDDGPNEGTTNVILDILREMGVKATFFVTCGGPDYLIQRIYNEGHTLALHTASHNYAYIYSSVDNYFNDLNRVSNRVTNLTGLESKIIRFPGGSSNTVSRNYNVGIMSTLTGEVLARGYRYYDWNVDSMDASSARNSNDVYYNVVGNLSPNRANVVLMHDVKAITRDALRDIIRFGLDNGYSFNKIENDTYMVRHSVNN